MENIFLLFLAGALGALSKDILKDNKLKLPSLCNSELDLGFVGGMIIGAFAGWAIDGSYVTAFTGGATGSLVLGNLTPRIKEEKNSQTKSVEDQIREIAKSETVDPDLAVRVARCESGLNPQAININAPDSIDRGLFQINSKWHPEVSETQAFDIEFSTRFFCKAFKNGNLSWWEASKKCWNK